MSWGRVELEPEVRDWLLDLPDEEFGHVAFYIDLLQEQGVLLDEPYTHQLKGKLRELRFYPAASGAESATTSPPSVESCC